ncbi:ATP-binding protein [Streptomyces sp. VRA16 Mangrove soil]|uniref:ATP-binding protein n=1 Tax=Streptomyces sp. VRA16 Mangrove soil TaxID=2817434 RepID=UPI001A9D8F81|nr:ATP-binding protein [Streptomyces sp. VRA16 Mangrove soil]MBO1331469.1 ATP-binding protein [Streptomyces sp. VRA16 Mangrove soil]
MKRQVRGSAPTVVGGSATETTTARQPEVDGTEEGDGPPRQLTRKLGRADLRAVPETRRALHELLRHWGSSGRSEIAELLTSELVTNALVHTDRDAEITATVGPRGLRVEVRDEEAARRPKLRVPNADDGTHSTHGRGLILVQSLADAWGVAALGAGRTGKVVWFELDAGAGGIA